MTATPQFSAALDGLLQRRNLTRLAAAEISGLSRPVFTRLIRGEQWPAPEHLEGIAKLAPGTDARRELLDAITSDIATSMGLPRFSVSEAADVALLQVPAADAALLGQFLHVFQTDVMVREMVSAAVRTFCAQSPVITPRTRKNTGAPTASRVLPPKPKAS